MARRKQRLMDLKRAFGLIYVRKEENHKFLELI